jgi:hypothetical protein
VRRLKVEEAVRLAISQNRSLKIARLKIDENQQKKAGDRSSYFPVHNEPIEYPSFSPNLKTF